MRIAVEIAGFSMAKADTLRKAMGKKKQEIIDQEGENFIAGGVAKGHPSDKVRRCGTRSCRSPSTASTSPTRWPTPTSPT